MLATPMRMRKAKKCLELLEEMQYGKKKVLGDAKKALKLDKH